jgi:hypothetical protein
VPAQTGARRAAHSSIIVAGLVLTAACARDALDTPCPEVNVGELVVTELSGSDADPQWVELYNSSASTIDLTGVRLTVTKLDGSKTETFVVPEGGPTVAAGAYVVLDSEVELPGGAAIDVVTCGRPIDRMIYRNLPDTGTYAFTGLIDPPDDAENDVETHWCPDIGTPGERNPECPE